MSAWANPTGWPDGQKMAAKKTAGYRSKPAVTVYLEASMTVIDT